MSPDRELLRAGFVLMLAALLTGLLIPHVGNPRMALAAHVTGVLSALTLGVVAVAWPALARAAALPWLMRWSFVGAGFGNWLAGVLASVFGTRRLTPLNGGAAGAEPWQELLVGALQVGQAIAIIIAVALAIYALRPQANRSAGQ